MKFQIKTRAGVTLEPIAFADIVINLFVFFFLSFGVFATFDAPNKGLVPIHLPKGGQTAEPTHQGRLVLTVDTSGTIFIGSRVIALSALTESVNQELAGLRSKNVRIQADHKVQLNQLVPILDLLRKTNASAVSIETELT